ncbi:major facilitator superfamily MFS_1 [Isosphaera pallida ATCC 43644]|uniref:Major facilitator superfamily MFS_1 n=1 Tax=Isosphaera pallida (strain ATCC 43644 / DSM 9630 / IS1B) TaxID=575540 RepID=E8R547_ISOPI|nr:MFS transporter [Isosphaera pallida]ADV62804.1 major facilitator superfamily MFS_1 [Isosphaera pallida ATCC 43644]
MAQDRPLQTVGQTEPTPLDRARRKAFLRLLPLLFICYVIAYIDRNNIAVAKLTMPNHLDGFNDAVIGFGAGMFFIGYFLLEIPGSLIVERWSARKWICRIMVTWGIIAAAQAWVTTPTQFYFARFMLGLAEAGFYPGVIIYLTHWFPRRDRAKALAWFFVGTPVAMIVSPILSQPLINIGELDPETGEYLIAPILGLVGWQWIFIVWGIPAVVLGIVVLLVLTDRPHQARWLTPEERHALEEALARDKIEHPPAAHLSWWKALGYRPVVLLALAYFCVVTGNYAVETFLPSMLKEWYKLNINDVLWLVVLPPLGSLVGQLVVGWSSDRAGERRWHAAGPILLAAASVAGIVATVTLDGPLGLTLALFVLAATGLKSYLPAFWALPSLILIESAAASSVGFINSVGNLGGFVGPYILGSLKEATGSYLPGLIYITVSMTLAALILLSLSLGRRPALAAIPGTNREGGIVPDHEAISPRSPVSVDGTNPHWVSLTGSDPIAEPLDPIPPDEAEPS